MSEEKNCPIRETTERYEFCIEGRCAWYDSIEKMCVIKSGLLALRNLSEVMVRGEGVE